MKHILFSLLIIGFALFLFIGCSKDKEDWESAKKINSIESYQKFVKEYPESEFTELAKNKIDSIAYENTSKENTEDAYLSYYETYPNSKFATESRDKAASIAFENVKKANTVEAFQNFIKDYPRSEFVDKAKIIIDDIQNGRRYWSEKEFAEKIRNVDEKDFTALSKYKIKLIDGGNEHTFRPDLRNGSIPLFSWEEQHIGTVNVAHLVIVLYQESIAPYGGVGIGEIFFWHRSLMVFFIKEGKLQDKLYKLHISKSKKHSGKRGESPFSTICTFAGR